MRTTYLLLFPVLFVLSTNFCDKEVMIQEKETG